MQNRLIIGPPDNRRNLGGPEKRVLVGGFYPAADIYQQPEPTGLEVDREYGYDIQEIRVNKYRVFISLHRPSPHFLLGLAGTPWPSPWYLSYSATCILINTWLKYTVTESVES